MQTRAHFLCTFRLCHVVSISCCSAAREQNVCVCVCSLANDPTGHEPLSVCAVAKLSYVNLILAPMCVCVCVPRHNSRRADVRDTHGCAIMCAHLRKSGLIKVSLARWCLNIDDDADDNGVCAQVVTRLALRAPSHASQIRRFHN